MSTSTGTNPGNIVLNGYGGTLPVGTSSMGVQIWDNASITSASTTPGYGNITINATGYYSGSNYAMQINNSSTPAITTVNGNITLNMTGQMRMVSSAIAEIQSSGTGNITVQAPAPLGYILAQSITNVSGSISLTSPTIYNGGTIGGASDTGNITFIADTLTIGNNVQSRGELFIEPYTLSYNVIVNNSGSGALYIDSTSLSKIRQRAHRR